MSISNLSLFKRSNGIYYIVYVRDGRTYWKSTGKRLKHEALRTLTEFEQYTKEEAPKTSFSQFIEKYASLQRNSIRESTLTRVCLPSFYKFKSICGNKPLDSYSVRDVEEFKKKRLETCAPTTVNIEFRALRAAFNVAVRWQLLSENPFAKSAQVNVPERLPSHLSKEDFKRLLSRVKEPVLQEVFLFAALTGLRLGEILNLRWKNVDLKRLQIAIVSGEGFNTKSGNYRIVPMNEHVIKLITGRSTIEHFTPFVFHRNGIQLQQSYVSHKFKKYVRSLGLGEGIHFHSLRHTFATWLVQDGVSIYEVQKLLGHSSVKVTEVYSHLAASELHSVVNRINLSLN